MCEETLLSVIIMAKSQRPCKCHQEGTTHRVDKDTVVKMNWMHVCSPDHDKCLHAEKEIAHNGPAVTISFFKRVEK